MKDLAKQLKECKYLFFDFPEPIAVIDNNGKILMPSIALKRLFGYKKDLIGKNIFDLSFDRSKKMVLAKKYIKSVLIKKKTSPYEIEVGDKKRGKRHIEINAHKIKYNETNSILVIFKDITEQKKTQQELVKIHTLLIAAIEQTPAGIVVAEAPRGKIIIANSAGLGIRKKGKKILTGIEAQQYQKRWQLFNPDGTACKPYDLPLPKAMRFGKTYENELFIKRPGGEKRWILATASPVRNDKGEIIAGIVVFPDITEHKKIEEKIKEINKKLEVIVQSVGDGLFVLDENKKIVLVNVATQQLSGYSQEELVGKEYTSRLKFILEKDKELNTKFIDDVYKTGVVEEMTNHTLLVRKNKKTIPITNTAAPLKDRVGRITGCVVIFRDVTKEREIDKMRTDFISMASHQLNTPLSAIKWYLELLWDKNTGPLNAKQRDYFDQIKSSNKRMISLVMDLLNISRIESGKKFVSGKKPTDITKIIKSIINENISALKKGGVKILICSDLPKKIVLNVDGDKFKQAFNNIMDNAIKYSKERGSVRICCRCDGKKSVTFSIKDNGLGIPEYQQERVFQKFFRADNIAVTGKSGTGLGLYISKAIIEEHGGKIWFKSTQNKGTTFYISLPR